MEGACLFREELVWETFLASLQRKGRDRIELNTQVMVNGKVAATIKGNFVIRELSDV